VQIRASHYARAHRLTARAGTCVIVALSDLRVRCAAQDADLVKLDALLIEGHLRCDLTSPGRLRSVLPHRDLALDARP